MPTLKKSNSATTFVFADDSYVDKLFAKNVYLDESNPAALTLKVELQHYSKRKRNSLEDSDFKRLQSGLSQIVRLALRDGTIAKKIQDYAKVTTVALEIDAGPSVCLPVKTQACDHREVAFEF